MEKYLMDILFEFLISCEKAADKRELLVSIERVNEHLGMKYFAMAFLPLAHERLDNYLVWERWPRDWLNRYLNQNYFHADPVANHARQSGSPVHWSRSLPRQSPGSKGKRIMDEARDFGLAEGLTIPLHSKTGLDGLFSVAGLREPLSLQESRIFQIVAASAHARLLGLSAPRIIPEPGVHITRSESECLTWCAAGKTDREIGQITGRSPRTVQAHIANLQRKLSVVNRAQLIAEAFRHGLQR
jgi:LuxR family quorum sensing-dependent transcriptional regulator